MPQFADTEDFERIASEQGGEDLGWFFDAYLRQAALPKLIEERDGNELSLTWQTEKGTPFPMPIEVQVDGKTILADMSSGSTVIDLGSDDAHYVIDPMAKVLRYSPSIARWQAWMVEQQEQAKKAKEEAKAAD